MKKHAIVTVAIGTRHQAISELTLPSMTAYAERVGADMVVVKEANSAFPEWGKSQVYSLLNKYQRVVLLDVDVIVRPDCPNLFDMVPDSSLGAFNQGAFEDKVNAMSDIVKTTGREIEKWEREYYNSGVVVASRRHKFLFDDSDIDVDGRFEPLFNLRINKSHTSVLELEYKLNRMQIMDKLTGEHRLASWIVHYAGIRTLPLGEQLSLIRRDLDKWKEMAPKYDFKRHLFIKTHGGLGDEICAEPVVRYIVEKAYKGADITVATWFPRLFLHLPVKIADINNFDKDVKPDTPYYLMETLVPPEHPSWQYMSANLMHATDFISQICLRAILPDKDKQIKLKVTLEDVSEVVDVLGPMSLSELVLVHPGRGWPSKTFPKEYWDGVIKGLVDAGLKVVLIGRHLSDEQGTVDVDVPPGVMDARNLLGLGGLIALISQAKVLVSNDSAPVHIAGAFDNWIILIPTCKHPDHVLPLRDGLRSYRSEVLHGKRLLSDDIESVPTQVHGKTIDKVKGDIMEYLPDTSKVVEAAKRAMSG